MGREEAVYGDATTFRPERWIPTSHPDTLNSEEDVRDLKKHFHLFSIGSNDCAGSNVALFELQLVCARTVWKTDIRIAPGSIDGEGRPELGWGQRIRREYMVRDSYLCLKKSSMLQFRRRVAKSEGHSRVGFSHLIEAVGILEQKDCVYKGSREKPKLS
jgi:hypothetical protein